jgi:hypothetical protein
MSIEARPSSALDTEGVNNFDITGAIRPVPPQVPLRHISHMSLFYSTMDISRPHATLFGTFIA